MNKFATPPSTNPNPKCSFPSPEAPDSLKTKKTSTSTHTLDATIFTTSPPIREKEAHALAMAKNTTSLNSKSLHLNRLPNTPPPGSYEK